MEGGHFFQQDLARFDAPFFHMTAAEAAALDPQQRLLLECSYEAMENAGIPLDQFCGTMTSVFAGAFCTDYTDVSDGISSLQVSLRSFVDSLNADIVERS